jgi:GNAT superfamily N-acetyltransferase
MVAFPLTPALSLGERGKRAQIVCKSTAGYGTAAHGFYKTIRRLFPLPKGEGQGEGKGGENRTVRLNFTQRFHCMTPFTISAATESDVPFLLAMIRELAEFEHLAHEVEITAASLREALFGERPVAGALLARADGQPAGYAVYYRTFSTFVGRAGVFLDDLYVRPEYRKRGIGRALLERVAAADTTKAGGGRLEWIALRWNENAFRFYRSLGAKVMDDWALLRMNGNEVRNLVSAKVKVAA